MVSTDPVILPPEENSRVPQAPYPFRHSLRAQTRFVDYDMLGHLNNTVYLSLFDLAKARYFEAVMQEPIDWHKPGMVVVNLNCDFYAPTYCHDEVMVLTTVEHLGSKSMTLEQRLVDVKTLATKARCRTVMATFDPSTLRSAPMPSEWIERLTAFEGREIDSQRS